MRTDSVDLAAYLDLAGLQPEVTANATGWISYEYRDTEFLRHCIDAYQSDAMVPVQTFIDARRRMKKLGSQAAGKYPRSRRQKGRKYG